ncbi:hypothetical protein FBZ33_6535 [Micromonospora sp. A202]|uniref:hypothetical protein n=1 Tax=Micromonospora sp. A202 TaxID=2572899 RepID=UPI00114F2513|nr:hypothetical protein [Micromonospora sp. A202]TQJ26149.1 hypothetical protein FBZ33_6535 [Micromonospora sp. A202]
MPMGEPREVPDSILTHLVGALVKETAQFMLQHWQPDGILQPPDPFGMVLEWMWVAEPDRAVAMVSDLLWQLRRGGAAGRSITLDTLMVGLPLAVCALPPEQVDALLDRVETEVPQHLGEDVNT